MNFNITWAKTVLQGSDTLTDSVVFAMDLLSDAGYRMAQILAIYNGEMEVVEINEAADNYNLRK